MDEIIRNSEIMLNSSTLSESLSQLEEQNTLRNLQQKLERDFFRKLLIIVLKREPMTDDYNRITIGYRKNLMGYSIAFDGVHIGDAEYHFPSYIDGDTKYIISFSPVI